MILGHVMGIPVEETAATVPALVVVVSALAVTGRSRLRQVRDRRRRDK